MKGASTPAGCRAREASDTGLRQLQVRGLEEEHHVCFAIWPPPLRLSSLPPGFQSRQGRSLAKSSRQVSLLTFTHSLGVPMPGETTFTSLQEPRGPWVEDWARCPVFIRAWHHDSRYSYLACSARLMSGRQGGLALVSRPPESLRGGGQGQLWDREGLEGEDGKLRFSVQPLKSSQNRHRRKLR